MPFIDKHDQNVFSWWQLPDSGYRLPFVMTFWSDGRCASHTDAPGWGGNYEYNSATRKLKFWDSSFTTPSISEVSLLDETYLIIDNFHNGELLNRNKYYRVRH